MPGCPIVRTEAHQSTSCHASSSCHRCGSYGPLVFLHWHAPPVHCFLDELERHIKSGCQDLRSTLGRRTTSKLGPIVGDNPVWDHESAYDGLDELHCGLLVDFDHWGCFLSLGELVDGDIEESVPSDGAGKWPHDVQPPHSEGP
jgi:hypothetical protein